MLSLFVSRALAYDISPRDLAEQGPGNGGSCLLALGIMGAFVLVSLIIMKIAERSKE